MDMKVHDDPFFSKPVKEVFLFQAKDTQKKIGNFNLKHMRIK